MNLRGEILLQLRDNNPRIPFPNHWGLIGGSVERGETVEEALMRETLEEVGETLTDYKFVGVAKTMTIDIHVFVARLDKLAGSLPLTEGQRVQFFTPYEAMELPLVPWLHRTLPAFARSNLYAAIWDQPGPSR